MLTHFDSLHFASLVYRDIKKENIVSALLEYRRIVKIICLLVRLTIHFCSSSSLIEGV